MRHLSLFSGIGGFDLAAEWMGWKNVAQVEIDKFCLKVLKKNFPFTKRYEDIRKFPASNYIGRIDIITGGFPCQPFSQAGSRRGTQDDRYLWPEMLRVIQIIRPQWIIAENVRGILTVDNGLEFEKVCINLEFSGYEVQAVLIPAIAVNAPHKRDRVWFIAHTNSNGKSNESINENERQRQLVKNNANSNIKNVERGKQKPKSYTIATRTMAIPELWKSGKSLLPETVLCRTNDGISDRMDRTKALGNAIVPQVAYQIFKSISSIS